MIRTTPFIAEQDISGFHSPADDYLEGRLNIHDRIIIDPECTFYFKMDSDEMKSFGIEKDDLLVVDKSLKPVKNSVIIAVIEGEFYCRLIKETNPLILKSDINELKNSDSINILTWGVVTVICRNLLPSALKTGRYKYVCAM